MSTICYLREFVQSHGFEEVIGADNNKLLYFIKLSVEASTHYNLFKSFYFRKITS